MVVDLGLRFVHLQVMLQILQSFLEIVYFLFDDVGVSYFLADVGQLLQPQLH